MTVPRPACDQMVRSLSVLILDNSGQEIISHKKTSCIEYINSMDMAFNKYNLFLSNRIQSKCEVWM